MIVDHEDGDEPGGLVVLWSRAADIAGRHYPFDATAAPITIGRKDDNAIVLDDDGISRHHTSPAASAVATVAVRVARSDPFDGTGACYPRADTDALAIARCIAPPPPNYS